MNQQNMFARRELLKGTAAVAAGLALQRRGPAFAQDATPEPEPEEVTAREAVEGKLNVSWWSHNNPAFVAANLEMIDRFQAENPDINITYQYFPYDIFISKLQAGYNSGTVADIQQMFGTWVTQYAGFGLLDPVPANLSEGMADRFFEAAIGAYGLNGQYFGMPKEYNLENGSMLVNPALLEEAGVTGEPATWDALMENAVKATKYDDQDRITQAGFLMTGNDAITFLFLAMILQQGGTYWADDGVHVNFQTEAAAKAWQAETDIVTKYHVDDETSIPNPDRYVVFFQGKGAMCMVGPWAIAVGHTDYPDLDFNYVNMPTFAGDEYRFAAESGWGEVVNANAPAENKEAAWKFIDFMAQPDNLRDWNIATYTIPAVKALLDDPTILESAPLFQASFNVLPYGQWIGPVQDRDRFFQSIHDAFSAVALGQMDAPAALLQAEQQINQMIDEIAGP
ncbi:MAG: ABC transporter substrate-binding protein [Thermomicrobiales bacterium]|nr:ABC transporter substrate-binding protein [Thermomicrobiales bacterium]